MEVTAGFGANVTLSDCIALHTIESWTSFLEKPETEIVPGGNPGLSWQRYDAGANRCTNEYPTGSSFALAGGKNL